VVVVAARRVKVDWVRNSRRDFDLGGMGVILERSLGFEVGFGGMS
jgi:hypothetical protein